MDFSRNHLFISADTQSKLAECRILICGSGIGSVFAELALRTGNPQLTVCDGDVVEASNLNRQNYVHADLGTSKAASLTTRLQAINPQARLQTVPRFLQRSDLASLIPEHDIVINTIDFDRPEFLLCRELCQKHGKIEFFPMNLGFGASLCLFDKTSPAWEEVFTCQDHVELKQQILLNLAGSDHIGAYLKEAAQQYFNAPQSDQPDPQLGISSYLCSALIMAQLVKYLSGSTVTAFPVFHYIDAYQSIEIPLARP
jgi:molybdopterin/thiamine biosynthesis adenylyltransferase